MFERYTERARRVLFFARYEATQLGSTSMEPEHIVLGLLRDGGGIAQRILTTANLNLADLRGELELPVRTAADVPPSVEIPFSASCKRALQFAAEEAERRSHNYIGAGHLLLGVLREESSEAAKILARRGLTLEDARRIHEEVLRTGAERPTAHVEDTDAVARRSFAEIHKLLAELAVEGTTPRGLALIDRVGRELSRLEGLWPRAPRQPPAE